MDSYDNDWLFLDDDCFFREDEDEDFKRDSQMQRLEDVDSV